MRYVADDVGPRFSLHRCQSRHSLALPCFAAFSPAGAPLHAADNPLPHYTHVFRHGKLIDGTGNHWRYADVATVGDRIAFVGNLRDHDFTADHVHDIAGQGIAPGFTDPHHDSTGFAFVVVNGQPVVVDNTPTDTLPGKPLRATSPRP